MKNGFSGNVARVARNPGLILSLMKRYVLLGGVRTDPECINLVNAWSSGKLQRVTVGELFPGIDSCASVLIRKPEARFVGASVDLQELVHMTSVARHISANRILEIGTFDGFTAINLAANLGDQGELVTVDLPEDRSAIQDIDLNATASSRIGAKYRGEIEERKIRQLRADSRTSDWNNFGGPFDMIFIDGGHTYACVMSDSVNAMKHVRPGGVIFWHDYGIMTEVSNAVDELAREHPIFAITGTRLACFRSALPSAF